MAYLAITYAQSGNLPKAKELGNNALKVAPSEDARARFSAFVQSLDEEGAASSPERGNVAPQLAAAQAGGPAAPKTGIDGFIQAVRSNPIAGPKFATYESGKDGTLRLLFRNFPMQGMPPFAKEKFFSNLKKAAADAGLSDVSELAFVDADTGVEMERVGIR
jgi:hypothetical protein